ncbi:MAG TPA: methyltransferase domain-containing protein [Acidimicrobiales bacterium]|jgi:SAM-dependent methyltransferase|nr:methyltransferase domain-containing protein [Acidimicrobiales bacterium]
MARSTRCRATPEAWSSGREPHKRPRRPAAPAAVARRLAPPTERHGTETDILSTSPHADPTLAPYGVADEDLTWPGDELVSRVATGQDKAAFYESGRQSVRDLRSVLALLGRDLDSYGTILDFGCGCGRILVHLERLAGTAEVHGCDIDARAVRWDAEHLPWARFAVNQPVPPLPYDDATFDLVYNHSVFTHLDEEHQDLWLAELRRVTRPGATLVLTVHGDKPLADFEVASANAGGNPAAVVEEVRRNGIAFIEHDSFTGGPLGDAYHSTFHAPWYVLEHWSRFFTVRAYVPQRSLGFQDVVLLERPPADVPIAPPRASIAARRAAATGNPPAGGPAPPPLPDEPVLPAVRHAVSRPLHGPPVGLPARYGGVTRAVRRTVLRLLGHYAGYQREVDRDIQRALRELDASVARLRHEMDQVRSAERVQADLTLQESDVRLWDALRRHGERVNRLETDLFEALDRKADRPERP